MLHQKTLLVSCLMICASILAISRPAAASPGRVQADDMPLGAPTLAPHGFLEFCTHNPQACGLDSGPDVAEQTEHALMQNQWALVFAAATPAPNVSSSNTPAPQALPEAPALSTAAPAPALMQPIEPTAEEAPILIRADTESVSPFVRPSAFLDTPLIP